MSSRRRLPRRSHPTNDYEIDFYANQLSDLLGYGEGKFYLGSKSVTNGGDSNATFTAVFPIVTQGRFISATATDPFGNVSEF